MPTASMVQLTGGAFQSPSGEVLANGSITFELSQDSQVNTNSQVSSGYIIKVLLDENGNASETPPQFIWGNDSLTPTGSFYYVSVHSAQGQLVWGPNQVVILSTDGDLGTIVPPVTGGGTGCAPAPTPTVTGCSGCGCPVLVYPQSSEGIVVDYSIDPSVGSVFLFNTSQTLGIEATLPRADSMQSGQQLKFKFIAGNLDSLVVIIAPDSGDAIEIGQHFTFDAINNFAIIESDCVNTWYIFQGNQAVRY